MYIVKFRYKYRRNNRWSAWTTWHGKETYETLDEAKAQLWQAYKHLKKELENIACKIEFEIVLIKTIVATTVEL